MRKSKMLESKVLENTVRKDKILRGFLYVLPVVLYFSYWPVIKLGANETMNFELSLPLIFLVIFDIFVAVRLTQRRAWGGILHKWKWCLLPIWLTMTAFWSLNFTRGVLTAGIIWLIYFAGYGLWEMREVWTDEKFRRSWWKVFFGAAIMVVVWCVVQCALDLAGVAQEATLMCDGCRYVMFGFPHPNGLAIEPQFMGNLLLAPAIMAGYFWIKRRTWGNGVIFLILAMGVFLTFSRGAIFAFGIGMIAMVVWLGVKEKKWKQGLMAVGIMAVAFLVTLCGQGWMAQMSRTDDTFQTGVAKVINHLSLGVIEIPVEKPVEESEVGNEVISGEVVANDDEAAVFDGYVAESTETRVRLTDAAVTIWRNNPMTVMTGVGLGGAGQALYDNGLSPAPKEIVQNEYASLLLETGVVGIILLLYTVYLIVKSLWGERGAVIVVLISYGVTLMFFSGVANALHIYILPVILALALTKKQKCDIMRR